MNSIKPEAPVMVHGYTDQHGQRWIAIKLRESSAIAWASVRSFMESRTAFWVSLLNQHVIITSSSIKKLVIEVIDGLEYSRRAYVVDHIGLHGDLFVWPGRALPPMLNGERVIDHVNADAEKWRTAGTEEQWLKEIGRLATGQHLITTALCLGFAGPLLRFFPGIENPGFELVGGTSTGKTTLLRLVGTIWGGRGEAPEGFTESWNTTVNGLELTLASHADCLLLLDEANLVDVGGTDAANKLRQAAFFIASGKEKRTKSNSRHPRSYRLVYLSSSNRPIAELITSTDRRVASAVDVRLITIPAEVGHGIFNSIPEGCYDSADAVGQLQAIVTSCYGWAGRAFVEGLEGALAESGSTETLKAWLQGRFDAFIRRARVPASDGPAGRIAAKFALAYAAGALARDWGLLPVGDVLGSVMATYRHYLQQAPQREAAPPAIAVVRNYARAHRNQLYDITGGEHPQLEKAAFNAAFGFLRVRGDDLWLLVPPARWANQFGTRARPMLRELAAADQLSATEGFCRQVKVRDGSATDRVHAVKLGPASAVADD